MAKSKWYDDLVKSAQSNLQKYAPGVKYSPTGLGADGKFQKNNPTEINNGNIFHEGEMKGDDGSVISNDDLNYLSKPFLARTMQDQEKIKMLQKKYKMKGYAEGKAPSMPNLTQSVTTPKFGDVSIDKSFTPMPSFGSVSLSESTPRSSSMPNLTQTVTTPKFGNVSVAPPTGQYDANVDTQGGYNTAMGFLAQGQTGITNATQAIAAGPSDEQVNKYAFDNPWKDKLTSGMDLLESYTTGNSKADQTAANIALSNYDASSGVAGRVAAMRSSTNPNLTAGAQTALAASTNRDIASGRAQMGAELAKAAQERAYKAANDFATMALNVSNFERENYQFAVNTARDDLRSVLDGEIAAGNMSIAQANTTMADLSNRISVATNNARNRMEDDHFIATNSLDKERLAMDARAFRSTLGSNASSAIATSISLNRSNPSYTRETALTDNLPSLRDYYDSLNGDGAFEAAGGLGNATVKAWADRQIDMRWDTPAERQADRIRSTPEYAAAQAVLNNPNSTPAEIATATATKKAFEKMINFGTTLDEVGAIFSTDADGNMVFKDEIGDIVMVLDSTGDNDITDSYTVPGSGGVTGTRTADTIGKVWVVDPITRKGTWEAPSDTNPYTYEDYLSDFRVSGQSANSKLTRDAWITGGAKPPTAFIGEEPPVVSFTPAELPTSGTVFLSPNAPIMSLDSYEQLNKTNTAIKLGGTFFEEAPDVGDYIKIGDKTYVASSAVTNGINDKQGQYVTAINPSTGEEVVIDSVFGVMSKDPAKSVPITLGASAWGEGNRFQTFNNVPSPGVFFTLSPLSSLGPLVSNGETGDFEGGRMNNYNDSRFHVQTIDVSPVGMPFITIKYGSTGNIFGITLDRTKLKNDEDNKKLKNFIDSQFSSIRGTIPFNDSELKNIITYIG